MKVHRRHFYHLSDCCSAQFRPCSHRLCDPTVEFSASLLKSDRYLLQVHEPTSRRFSTAKCEIIIILEILINRFL
jgi:hypothetical protein